MIGGLLEAQGPFVITIYAILVTALGIALVALIRGPGLSERALALDIAGTISAALIAVTVIAQEQGVLIDVALVVAIAGFLSVVAFARFIELRGRGG